MNNLLIKSCKESKITKLQPQSALAGMFFNPTTPHRTAIYSQVGQKVEVLQVMVYSDDMFLVEYIDID